VVALLVSAAAPPHAYVEQPFVAAGTTNPLLAPFQREDALWYQHIAAAGYDIPQAAAFMPLFPLAIRVVGAAIGSQALAALLIPTVCTLVALWLLHDLVRTEIGIRAATRTVVLIGIAPAAFFLWAPFSESMFLLESVAVFWLARRGQHAAAGVVAVLSVLTRLQGAVLLVPLMAHLWLHHRRDHESWRALLRSAAIALGPPLAVLSALAVAFSTSGWHLGLLGAQALWHAHPAAPWSVLAASVAAIAGGHHPEELVNLLSLLAAAATLPVMWRRLPPPYALFTGASLLVILCHSGGNSPLMSASRFVTVIFPVFIVLATLLEKRSRFRLVAVVFAASSALLFAAMVEYVFVA